MCGVYRDHLRGACHYDRNTCQRCGSKLTERGGPRKGAGRPKLMAEPRRVTVKLDGHDVEWLLDWAMGRELSGVSAAVRELIREKRTEAP